MSAGTHTTRHALCVGTVYALQKPEVGERLLRELREVMPGVRDVASLKELESLPYLVRCYISRIGLGVRLICCRRRLSRSL